MPQISIAIEVANADVLRYRADVLVLKHAQALYGVDGAVYEKLATRGSAPLLPKTGAYQFEPAYHSFGVDRILIIGVERLSEFRYAEIREFGRKALSILGTERPQTQHIALTLHGPGYGLDETEAFESELAGIIEAISQNEFPPSLSRITFVELNRNRSARLANVLSRLVPTGQLSSVEKGPLGGLDVPARNTLRSAGYKSASKPHVFIAMPFADEMSDVFHYGIQGAVNAAGLLAERADLSVFTGDVIDWIRTRISTSELVIADMTSANPNVYLEVGYAWGRGVPTVLISRNGADLKFDVRGQRCVIYSSIKDLEAKLTTELIGLTQRRI